jgi:RNase adapter protein RapZ
MSSKKVTKRSMKQDAKKSKRKKEILPVSDFRGELVILTGLSGSGKLSALKAFEDLGYYSVDNLPLQLVPRFADLVRQSAEIERAALVVDVREGMRLEEFPSILKDVRKVLPTRVVFLEASEEALIRRFSETRRPHPMGRSDTVVKSIRAERKRLASIPQNSMCTIFGRVSTRSLNAGRAIKV